MSRQRRLADIQRIAPLAWPVFVGQIAVLGFSTVDTVFVSRTSALDLAALAVGQAAYISIFVALMGVVLSVGPIAGQSFGAGKRSEAGRQLHQAIWLALACSVIGCALMMFPEPFLAIAQASGELEHKARGYLRMLAIALPFTLLMTAFRGFNVAVSRPKIVMTLQLAGLAAKVPLSALLVFGATLETPIGTLNIASQGVVGAGMATALISIGQVVAAAIILHADRFYRSFELPRGLAKPELASLRNLLKLGVPMGLSIGVEVTGFTFMALFISRLGPTPVAGHQLVVNMVALMYMVPLSIGNASATLVAQRIGARDLDDARTIGWHGVQLALSIAAALAMIVWGARGPLLHAYTSDEAVIAAARPLVAWIAIFHIADALQTVAAFVLRSHRVATMPLVIYTVAIWGVGIGGGYLLAFDVLGGTPAHLQGARGFWSAATVGLVIAGVALITLMRRVLRQELRH